MATDAAVEVRDLCKSYSSGLFRRALVALQEVSFEVARGEVFGLLGPNGAGKTTLIKILLGIVHKSRGEAFLLGRPAGDRRSRLRVGYLPENLRVAAHHSGQTAMEYYGALSGLSRREVRTRSPQLLEAVQLGQHAGQPVRKYSKGMLQRLGIAQALLPQPELLILDEPTDGLDPLGRSQVRNVLRDLRRQGKTVFLNSHILQEVEMVCDRVAILDRGQLRAVGSMDELAPQSSASVEVELTLAAQAELIREALGARGILRWSEVGGGQFRVVLRLQDQRAVDACIDDLRQRQISMIELSRRKITLEDAFLTLVGSPQPAEAGPASHAGSNFNSKAQRGAGPSL